MIKKIICLILIIFSLQSSINANSGGCWEFDKDEGENLEDTNFRGITGYPCTLAIWIKPSEINTFTYPVFGLHRLISQNNFYRRVGIIQITGSNYISAEVQGYYDFTWTSTNTFQLNTWNFVCVVFNSTTARSLWLNSTETANASTSGANDWVNNDGMGDLKIAPYWSGRLAFPTVWNVALTDDEVLQMANGLVPSAVRPEAIEFILPYNEVKDKSGNGKDPVQTNGSNAVIDGPPVYYPKGGN